MILSTEVEVTINTSNFKHYKEAGYKNIRVKQKIVVPINKVYHNGYNLIEVKCDVCGHIKTIKINRYFINLGKWNIYACSPKCGTIKTKMTSMEIYGETSAQKNKIVKEKKERTNIERYGGTSPSCSDVVKKKIKCTNLKRYGVDNVMKNNEFKNKQNNSLMVNYGVKTPIQNAHIRKKIERTNIERYGSKSPLESSEIKEKIKKHNLNVHGVDYPFQSKSFRDNAEEETLLRYGTKYVAQIERFFLKQQKNSFNLKLHKKTRLFYRGTYEKDFLDFCYNNKIYITKGKVIKYHFQNKTKTYFSDFYMENINLIIEIKSNYTYKRDLKKNLSKQKACIKQNYKFIFIIDKNYKDFLDAIKL